MKKLLSTLTLLALGATAVSGCASGAPAGDQPLRIGVSVYANSSFITQGHEGVDAYAEANDIDVLWQAADFDVNTQATQVEQLINQRVDAILLAPVQPDSLAPQLALAKEKGIPVIAVNAQLDDTSALASSVQPDDVVAGSQAAQMMIDHLGGSGNVVILQGALGSSFEINRTNGMQEAIAKSPGISVLAEDAGNWSRDDSINLTRTWLNSFPGKIDGIIAQNDDMALGALQATREAGLSIPIVGIDGIEDALNAVKDGGMIGTQLQHGRVELAAGLAVAERVAKGESVEPLYTYLMPPVTSDNVDAVIANVVTEKDAFLKGLPALVDANLETGDIANEKQ
ncbi:MULTISPECIES: substrate-binding domain-containing protein [Microbacterium]|uniref:substrate-binding domain-containing protein n=1 Tax=Microbacterium TaxID=33882 RepID=UPI00278491B2|nr:MULTISPECIES: substrate-binding domain-containing protein [Microbacterium]MDQ1085355.1 ribose transport system substrate-binding protein [Microbacterium sp. SORGH_AS_0344]MDQ1169340.1 ribose transport system substrate-binding protein [Microbacterium proteolyticum]